MFEADLGTAVIVHYTGVERYTEPTSYGVPEQVTCNIFVCPPISEGWSVSFESRIGWVCRLVHVAQRPPTVVGTFHFNTGCLSNRNQAVTLGMSIRCGEGVRYQRPVTPFSRKRGNVYR